MMRFNSIRVKSSLPVLVTTATFIIALSSLLYVLDKNEAALTVQTERYFKASSVVLNADRDLYQAELAQQRLTDGVGNDGDKKDRTDNIQQVKDRFAAFLKYVANEPAIASQFSDFDNAMATWLASSEAALKASGTDANFAVLAKQEGDNFSALRSILNKAGEVVEQRSEEARAELLAENARFEKIALSIVILGLLVAVWFSYRMPKVLTGQVRYIGTRIREISEGDGDLTQRIEFATNDELGDLAHEFNGFVEKLRGIISSIHNQSRALGKMTENLNGVANETGSITSALASASESIVSAGHQMDMSNQQMASVASSTSAESQNSNALAQNGLSAVQRPQNAVSELVSDIENALGRSAELQKSSEDIASVLEVIRNIAEQTNLLALNAAIEAARAGEQGRGFAVVADEVRTLATRTQDSTDEIETMIETLKNNVTESYKAIQNSRDNAGTTANNFGEVTEIFYSLQESFGKVQDMAAQTAQATQEQTDVANEINRNMSSLKDQTQSVQSVSDMIQKQAHQISELYEELDRQVGSFKV